MPLLTFPNIVEYGHNTLIYYAQDFLCVFLTARAKINVMITSIRSVYVYKGEPADADDLDLQYYMYCFTYNGRSLCVLGAAWSIDDDNWENNTSPCDFTTKDIQYYGGHDPRVPEVGDCLEISESLFTGDYKTVSGFLGECEVAAAGKPMQLNLSNGWGEGDDPSLYYNITCGILLPR